MVQFVVVNVDTSALFAPATRAYGNLGVVGYGTSGSLTEAKVFERQSDVETEYGAVDPKNIDPRFIPHFLLKNE